MGARDENSYGNILKRISAFGGVQVFNILITLVRGKFVALLLGPAGMGVSQLFTSSVNTLQQLSGLGLNLAFVKEVAPLKDDPQRLGEAMSVARRLILLTSLLGALVCAVLSPWLSLWTFGNSDNTVGFVILSVAVAAGVAGSGYLAVLQGLGEVRRLSKASVVGGLTGLLFGVPLFYFFGIGGIVPSMVILSLAMFLFYYVSCRKAVKVERPAFSWSRHRRLIRKLVSLGIVLMVGSLVNTLITYIINLFIRTTGSVEDVGLFQGANSLTQQYVGIIFSALALDYFPRLSAISSDSVKMREVVNRQSEIIVSIVTPLVLVLILTAPFVIWLLLDQTFMGITPLMRWLGFGVLVQAVSFPLNYIFLVKDNRKIYIWVEIVMSNVLWLSCSVIFYHLFSLVGLGISLVVRSAIDVIVTYVVCRRCYGFRYSRKSGRTVAVCMLFGCVGFGATMLEEPFSIVVLVCALAASLCYSFITLRKGLKKN